MVRGFALMSMLLAAAPATSDQAATPQLSRTQRDTLRRVVAAVETASAEPETTGAKWQLHNLRTSDGSHYVAFSVEPPTNAPTPVAPLIVYVRLTSVGPNGLLSERSAVAEWLAGERIDPMLRPAKGIAIGEMPNFGAGAIAARGSTASTGSTDLRIMDLQRERARQAQEERDRQRRQELEGTAQIVREVHPFEDFDFSAVASAPTGTLQRAFTAGPGDYELSIAWVEAARSAAPVSVVKRRLRLPPAAATELAISSVIVADQVGTRDTQYPPLQQSAHPYAIGLMEIAPARDSIFTRDERLTIVFQVVNASPSEFGKPDIAVSFRIVRMNGDREQPVASLTPQQYTADTLPADFDLRLGHPLFVAMAAPLATLARGEYRLRIAVNDRLAGRGVAGDTEFTIAGTPASLLAEAPSLGSPFRREMALAPTLIEEVARAWRPSTPSPQLTRALETLRQRRFVDLMQEEPVAAQEQGVRLALTAVALFALGDPSSTIQFQRSIQAGGPAGPAQVFMGAARALEGREADAVAAWRASLDAGMPPTLIAPLLINAYLRRGETSQAVLLLPVSFTSTDWNREQAAVRIGSGRESEAIPLLEARLASHPDDADAEWLLLHALFANLVRSQAAGPSPAVAEKFARTAQTYVARDRSHSTLVKEWLNVLPSVKP